MSSISKPQKHQILQNIRDKPNTLIRTTQNANPKLGRPPSVRRFKKARHSSAASLLVWRHSASSVPNICTLEYTGLSVRSSLSLAQSSCRCFARLFSSSVSPVLFSQAAYAICRDRVYPRKNPSANHNRRQRAAKSFDLSPRSSSGPPGSIARVTGKQTPEKKIVFAVGFTARPPHGRAPWLASEQASLIYYLNIMNFISFFFL